MPVIRSSEVEREDKDVLEWDDDENKNDSNDNENKDEIDDLEDQDEDEYEEDELEEDRLDNKLDKLESKSESKKDFLDIVREEKEKEDNKFRKSTKKDKVNELLDQPKPTNKRNTSLLVPPKKRGRKPKEEQDLRDRARHDRELDKSTSLLNTEGNYDRDKAQQIANEIKSRRKLPPVPGPSISLWSEFEQWYRLLNEIDFSHLVMYLYRDKPIIIRQLSGQEYNYIDIISEKYPDIKKYIVETHGGGKYRLLVNDTDLSRNSCICTVKFEIPINEVDPILNYEELDTRHRDNMAYIQKLKFKGILDKDGSFVNNPNNQNQNQNRNNGGIDSSTIALLDKVSSIYERQDQKTQSLIKDQLGARKEDPLGSIRDLLLEKLKQEDPNKQISMITTLVTMMQGFMPKHDSNNDQMQFMKMMMDMQAASFQAQMTLMTKMMENTKKEDPFDMFIKFKSLISDMIPNKEETEERKRSTTEVLIDKASEMAIPILNGIGQYLQLRTVQESVAKGLPVPQTIQQQAMGQLPSGNDPNLVQNPNMISGQNLDNQNQIQGNLNNQNQNVVNGDDMGQLEEMIRQQGGVIINIIKSGDERPGLVLAEQLISASQLSPINYYLMLKNLGKEKIITAMRNVMEFWTQTGQVYGAAFMEKFVDDFVNFEQIMREEEKEEGKR